MAYLVTPNGPRGLARLQPGIRTLMGFDSRLKPTAHELAAVISRLGTEDAAAVPLLDGEGQRVLLQEAEGLPFTNARPVVGHGDRLVRQDFAYCTSIPLDSTLRELAEALERLVNAAVMRVSPRPLAQALRFNDLVVQRYEPGSLGITPHRDHLRYVGLVAIVVLSGRA